MGIALLILVGVLAVWARHCWRWPYVTCKHCEGKKREYSPDGAYFRDSECAFCLTNGYRYRWELRWLTLL